MDPSGWKKVLDEKSGNYYYYNKKEKVTQWEVPECMREDVEDSDDEEPTKEAPMPKNEWRSKVDSKTGRTYYYNKALKETSWEKPPGFEDPESDPILAFHGCFVLSWMPFRHRRGGKTGFRGTTPSGY